MIDDFFCLAAANSSFFAVDIMDEFGEIRIPIKDHRHLIYDIVGEHLAHYDFMINLPHFKGHAMGGFGSKKYELIEIK